jgi:hypothetical protein
VQETLRWVSAQAWMSIDLGSLVRQGSTHTGLRRAEPRGGSATVRARERGADELRPQALTEVINA